MSGPLVRIVEAGLGPDSQVRLVVSRVSDAAKLQRAWASSGAALERVGDRIVATTTVQALARAAGRALGPDEAQRLETALTQSVAAWGAPAPDVPLPDGGVLSFGTRPLVMGIVNVTPDSFADGGLYREDHPDAAVAHARMLVDEGADILDIGGESTRPGAEPVSADEELARVMPVLEALTDVEVPRSIDTTKAQVARAALTAGATIVNDVGGGRNVELLEVTAEHQATYILMHSRGTPRDMQQHTTYDDVMAEVYEYLADGLVRCDAAGIPATRVLVDPGIGFAKTAAHNLVLLHGLRQLRGLGRAVLVGASRKSFLGILLDDAGPADRLEGSLACAALAGAAGAAMVRVHDVAATVRTMRVVSAVVSGRTAPAAAPA